jgi:hypothetical protein
MRPAKNAPHGTVKSALQRVILWDWFANRVKAEGPFDVAFWNGDMIDGKGEKAGGTESLTVDRQEQAEWAAEIIRFVGAKKNYMTYGTPYHGGASEDWEDAVKKNAKADKIEGEGHYNINGLVVVMKHYIGNSASPVSMATAGVKAMVIQSLWNALEQQPRANLIIRSHIHRCYYVGDPARNVAAWVTPALQGLGSKYGVRQCDGLPVHFGFLTLTVEDQEHYAIEPHIAPLTLQAAHTTRVTR